LNVASNLRSRSHASTSSATDATARLRNVNQMSETRKESFAAIGFHRPGISRGWPSSDRRRAPSGANHQPSPHSRSRLFGNQERWDLGRLLVPRLRIPAVAGFQVVVHPLARTAPLPVGAAGGLQPTTARGRSERNRSQSRSDQSPLPVRTARGRGSGSAGAARGSCRVHLNLNSQIQIPCGSLTTQAAGTRPPRPVRRSVPSLPETPLRSRSSRPSNTISPPGAAGAPGPGPESTSPPGSTPGTTGDACTPPP
jgi:hypothetical protein